MTTAAHEDRLQELLAEQTSRPLTERERAELSTLLAGNPDWSEDDLARVQRRREFPTRITQAIQVFLQNRVISRALAAKGSLQVPLAIRLLARFAPLRRIPARLLGLGVRPEHVRTPEATASRV